MTKAPPLRVLVTGAGGQLGQALAALAPQARNAGVHLLPVSRQALDICAPAAVARQLDAEPVAAVINAAAYTAVDRAEAEPDAAERSNALGPRVLAEACRERGIRLIQISTDYVFDGTKAVPYVEEDATRPLGVYGRTKLAGERAALGAPEAIVLRTGWVFSEFGHNFLQTMLRLGVEREKLAVVDDQFGGPTYAPAIARVLIRMLARRAPDTVLPGGIYHFGGTPAVTWYGFARAIFTAAHQRGLLPRLPALTPITTAEYPTAAPRPADARLDCRRLRTLLGTLDTDWRPGLAAALDARKPRS
jgi:dTDP-4-dehydrorhamnose reductase